MAAVAIVEAVAAPMVGVVVAFMGVVAEAFMVVVAGEASTEEGVEVDSAVGTALRLRQVMEHRAPRHPRKCAPAMGSFRDPGTITPDRGVLFRVGTSDSGMLPRRALQLLVEIGILSAAQTGLAGLQVSRRRLGHRMTAAGMFKAGIAVRGQPDRLVVFRDRVMMSGKNLPPGEM